MTSSETPKPKYFGRMIGLAIFVVVLFGGYSLGWFYFAGKLVEQVNVALAGAKANGTTADCVNPSARGFPFRIGVFCDSVDFSDGKGTSIEAGAFRTAAQVYNPSHIVGEVDGPAIVTLVGAQPLKLNWEALRASVRLASPLPERVSVEGRDLSAGTVSSTALVNARTFEGHMRPNGRDLDVAGSFGDLTADASLLEGRLLPPLSGEADLTLADGIAWLASQADSLRGQSATIRTLTLSTDASTGIGVSGTASADENGLVDADLTLTVRNAQGLAQVAAEAFPEASDQINKAMLGIAMLGQNTTLPLKISKGKASMGFIKLGRIPPVR